MQKMSQTEEMAKLLAGRARRHVLTPEQVSRAMEEQDFDPAGLDELYAALETRHAGSCGSKSDASHSSKPNWNRNSRAMRRKWWPDICIKFLWFIIHCR